MIFLHKTFDKSLENLKGKKDDEKAFHDNGIVIIHVYGNETEEQLEFLEWLHSEGHDAVYVGTNIHCKRKDRGRGLIMVKPGSLVTKSTSVE